MLRITVPGTEFFDESGQEFITTEDVVLELEHSLVSLSKWEQKFEKPFLSDAEKTTEEVLGYVEAMILSPEIPEGVLGRLTAENFQEIDEYINAKMTATWFNEHMSATKQKGQVITNELIYNWMFAAGINIECENWHLARLFTLIRIVSLQNTPEKEKRMSAREAAEQQRALNRKRKQELGTRG